jgi:hypothetical protein
MIDCYWFQTNIYDSQHVCPKNIKSILRYSNSDNRPVSNKLNVSFTGNTKEHDGQKHESYVFEKLVVHYLKIGGMKSSNEMISFLNTHNVCLNDTKLFSMIKDKVYDLADRLAKNDRIKLIPVLPEGGGSNYKIGMIAMANILHMKKVFETISKSEGTLIKLIYFIRPLVKKD